MIEADITGSDIIVCRGEAFMGETFRGPSAQGDLCRTLIGRGMDPSTPVRFLRGGKLVMLGSLSAFADRSYPSGEAVSIRWAPHPRGSYPEPLLAWHASRRKTADETAPAG